MHLLTFQIIDSLKKYFLSFFLVFLCLESFASEDPVLTEDQVTWLSQQIYSNECGRQADCLTSWNQGEDFPSLGIGHFIWYQAEQEEIFEETFPALMLYLQENNIQIPQWLIQANYESPWMNREQFLEDINKPRLIELRLFLEQQMSGQTQFIIKRFELALEKIKEDASETDRRLLEDRFYAVANSSLPYGIYALIDYLNFKGEGTSLQERYKGQGWGLKQVLTNMNSEPGDALQGFVISAQLTLESRVSNAPSERNEQRWLTGWKNRIKTYLPTSSN